MKNGLEAVHIRGKFNFSRYKKYFYDENSRDHLQQYYSWNFKYLREKFGNKLKKLVSDDQIDPSPFYLKCF